jgi:hypothetical protein
MCPLTHFHCLTLLTTVVASFIFGFLWYGPFFGKMWAELMGKKMEDCKGKKPPISALLLTLLGTFLTTMVMAYLLHYSKVGCTFGLATCVWLGFYVPLLLGTVTWEGKPWKLFILNGCFYYLNLQLIVGVLTFMG